jgi:tetratricopeptide (TPR) repeat protein
MITDEILSAACRSPKSLGLRIGAGMAIFLLTGCAASPPKAIISPPGVTQTSGTQTSTTPAAGQSQSSDVSTPAAATTASNQAATNSTGSSPNATPAGRKKPKSPLLARSFEDAVTRGDAAWLGGDANMAIYMYVQALSFRPRDVTTLTKLGVIEQRLNNLPLAARAYQLAANASPTDAGLSAQLGLVYLALGQDADAHRWLLRSADNSSQDWRVYDGLGILEVRAGDDAAALQHLQRAQALAPGVAAPLLHRGQAMFSSGDYATAETTVRAALNREATPEAWQLLGEIQAKRRAYSDSVDSLLEVLDPPAAYEKVAKTALENGDNAVALHYFEKASSLSPVYLPEVERDANRARERLDATGH